MYIVQRHYLWILMFANAISMCLRFLYLQHLSVFALIFNAFLLPLFSNWLRRSLTLLPPLPSISKCFLKLQFTELSGSL